MGEPSSVSAVRGVGPRQVLEAVEGYLDGRGLAPGLRSGGETRPGDVCIHEGSASATTVTWPAYFVPRDLAAAAALSRELGAVVTTVTTTDDEGWTHTLFGCGTMLDRFHSYPAALVWDEDDVAGHAGEWSGDHELVARVFGVSACAVRRHFCQARPDTRDHPGRHRLGYLELWSALGLAVRGDEPTYAAIAVDPAWQRLPG